MSYLVLARKYRSQRFDQVVGQEHVTRTLSNAITNGRVAHAILFSGPRGTGKTSVARILAKTINCSENQDSPVPCNECRSCREITAGNAVDVFEIDGASNNSVDQVRDLRENSRYMPAHSPCKIYIIDEVHMLSTAAFNALLKTLEEPPAHVMFLFATTEPDKIPVTILSRCQRHDLRRIDTGAVTAHLASLCEMEGLSMGEESLSLIARESGGSMRDALSLLDQVMGCSEGAATHAQVLEILGVLDRSTIFELAGALFTGDVPTILAIIDTVYSRGHSLTRLYTHLIEHLRDLLIVKMGMSGKQPALNLPPHEIDLMRQQVETLTEPHISQMLSLLFSDEQTVNRATQPKLAMEFTLIKMLQVKPALSMDRLIEKLDALRSEFATGNTSAPPEKTAGTQPSSRMDAGEVSRRKPTPSPRTADETECRRSPAGAPGPKEGASQPPLGPRDHASLASTRQAQPPTEVTPPNQAQDPTGLTQPSRAQAPTVVTPASRTQGPTGMTQPSQAQGPTGMTQPSQAQGPTGMTPPSQAQSTTGMTPPSQAQGPTGMTPASQAQSTTGMTPPSQAQAPTVVAPANRAQSTTGMTPPSQAQGPTVVAPANRAQSTTGMTPPSQAQGPTGMTPPLETHPSTDMAFSQIEEPPQDWFPEPIDEEHGYRSEGYPEPPFDDPGQYQRPPAAGLAGQNRPIATPPAGKTPLGGGFQEQRDAKQGKSGRGRHVVEGAGRYDGREPLDSAWQRIGAAISQQNSPLGACLLKSTLKNLTNQSIEIEVSGAFNVDRIKRSKNLAIITKVCSDFFGRGLSVTVTESKGTGGERVQKRDQKSRLEKEARENPVVTQAVETLGGKIDGVEILQD